MEHTKMEFETVNCNTEEDFKKEMNLLSYLGWLPLSTNSNSTALETQDIDKWQAILTRPLDYVKDRIKELEEFIHNLEIGKIGENDDKYYDAQITIHRNEIKQLTKEN